jgi:hypothetical protein
MNSSYSRIAFLGFISIYRIGVQLHQDADSETHLACQEERQVSFRSYTLDRGFVTIHQEMNIRERSAMTNVCRLQDYTISNIEEDNHDCV